MQQEILFWMGGTDIILKDDGTTFGALKQAGGELVIQSGSTKTTGLTFSGANATFAGTLRSTGNFDVNTG